MTFRVVITLLVSGLFTAIPVARADDTVVSAAATTGDRLPVWKPAGGEQISFDVRRNGGKFGRHVLSFDRAEDDTLTVVNDIDLTVKIGPITAFKYRHDSTEIWENNQLVSITGKTRKDGKNLKVEAFAEGAALDIDGTNYSGELPGDIVPSSHWNVTQIYSDIILSSEGGQPLDIKVEKLGREQIEAGGEMLEATRFRLTADMAVDLWYDDVGRWVKCAFSSRGQDIEYVLETLY